MRGVFVADCVDQDWRLLPGGPGQLLECSEEWRDADPAGDPDGAARRSGREDPELSVRPLDEGAIPDRDRILQLISPIAQPAHHEPQPRPLRVGRNRKRMRFAEPGDLEF